MPCATTTRGGGRPGEQVLELGAGTGVISRALLAAGLAPERPVAVEIVPDMAAFLRAGLPGVLVLQGDVRDLPALLPPDRQGPIGSVICGIPLVLLPLAEQRRFIDMRLFCAALAAAALWDGPARAAAEIDFFPVPVQGQLLGRGAVPG